MPNYYVTRSEYLQSENKRIRSEIEEVRQKIDALREEEQAALIDLRVNEGKKEEIELAEQNASGSTCTDAPRQAYAEPLAEATDSKANKWARILQQLPTDRGDAITVMELTQHANAIGIDVSEHTIYQKLQDLRKKGLTDRITFAGNQAHLWYRVSKVLKLSETTIN